jgi:hypothetical protein
MRLKLAALLALVVVGVLAASTDSALARERPRGAFVPGAVESPSLGLEFHDRVIWKSNPGSLEPRGVDRQRITTSDGYVVTVTTSPWYVEDKGYDEQLVGFLDSLLHGSELDKLTVYVAPPKEMADFCGRGAVACYYPRGGTIYIVGAASFGGFPTSHAVAHEYGHRIANYRRNPPFWGGALSWGTKRWATAKHVCPSIVAGRYSLFSYRSNPGEAFAESYAWSQLGRPTHGWEWDESLRPTRAALAALRADVSNPWEPVRLHRRGRVSSRKPRHVYTLRPLDGKLHARLTGGPGRLELRLLDRRGHLLKRGRPGGSRARLSGVVCGERKLLLAVRATHGSARYRLDVKLP